MGRMPQGSLLGLLLFMLLVDDLNINCSIHKFVDDATLTDILRRQSFVQQYLDALIEWTRENDMVINSGKTKEMTFLICHHFVQKQVKFNELNLLAVYVDEFWPGTATSITSQLRHPNVYTYWKYLYVPDCRPFSEAFYTAAIRPILEYCWDVWGIICPRNSPASLNQYRAIGIIYQESRHMPYHSLLYYSNITALRDRRSHQATRAHHGWDKPTWRDVSSYLFTYLPRNYDTPVVA